MKELLKKLRIICEDNTLSVDDVLTILGNSKDFKDDAELYEEPLRNNSIKIKNVSINGNEVIQLTGTLLFICTPQVFDQIVLQACFQYKKKNIDDLLTPFFDFDSFYEACLTNNNLKEIVLEIMEINNWDTSSLNGIDYIIMQR